jgi:hypothetical protein
VLTKPCPRQSLVSAISALAGRKPEG